MATVLKANFVQGKTNAGFVMIQREDLDLLGNDGAALAIWTILNEWAAYKAGPRQWGGETIFMEPGDVVFADRSLCDKSGFARGIVRRVLSTLEKLGLTSERRAIGGRYSKGTLIKLLKKTTNVATNATTNDAPSESFEPQGFKDAPIPEQPTQQPTQQPRSNKGERKKGKSKTICPAKRDESHTFGELLFIAGQDKFVPYGAVMKTCEIASRLHGVATLERIYCEALAKNVSLPLTFNSITFLNCCERAERGEEVFSGHY